MTTFADIQQIAMLIQFDGGTRASWASLTEPVPDKMMIYAIDTKIAKIGNGADLYEDLPPWLDFNNLVSPDHTHTPSQVGLGNVQNYGVATDPESTAAEASDKYITPRGAGLAILGKIASDEQAIDIANQIKLLSPYHANLLIQSRLSALFGVSDITTSRGWQTIYIPAAAISEPSTVGATAYYDFVSGADTLVPHLEFIKSTTAYGDFDFLLPACADPTSVKFQTHLLGYSGYAGGAVFSLWISALSNGSVVTDSWPNGNSCFATIPAGGYIKSNIVDMSITAMPNVHCRGRVSRGVTNILDTVAGPVGLVGVSVFYKSLTMTDIS